MSSPVAWEEQVMQMPGLECVPSPNHDIQPVLARWRDETIIIDGSMLDAYPEDEGINLLT